MTLLEKGESQPVLARDLFGCGHTPTAFRRVDLPLRVPEW
jgi:hypothetical protein